MFIYPFSPIEHCILISSGIFIAQSRMTNYPIIASSVIGSFLGIFFECSKIHNSWSMKLRKQIEIKMNYIINSLIYICKTFSIWCASHLDNRRKRANNLSYQLNSDILQFHVLDKLSINELGILCSTSRYMNNMVYNNIVWKHRIKYIASKPTPPAIWKYKMKFDSTHYIYKHTCALNTFYTYMNYHYLDIDTNPQNDPNMKIISWIDDKKVVGYINRALRVNIDVQFHDEPRTSLPDLATIERRILRLIFYPINGSRLFRSSSCTWKQFTCIPHILNERKKDVHLFEALIVISNYSKLVQNKAILLYNSLNSLFKHKIIEHHKWFPFICSPPRDYMQLMKQFTFLEISLETSPKL